MMSMNKLKTNRNINREANGVLSLGDKVQDITTRDIFDSSMLDTTHSSAKGLQFNLVHEVADITGTGEEYLPYPLLCFWVDCT
jgi:hypothetical protein